MVNGTTGDKRESKLQRPSRGCNGTWGVCRENFCSTATLLFSESPAGEGTGLPMCVHVCGLSHVLLSVTPWTVAHQVPLSVEFSRTSYHFLLQGGLPISSS